MKRLALHADAVKDQYRRGATFQELGERYGCAWQTMQRFLIACEEPLRPPSRKRKLDPVEADVLAAFNEGVGIRELAALYTVAPATLCRFLVAKRLNESSD